MSTPKTKIVNGQEFTLISYTNNGSHEATTAWYPTENLSWLREHSDVVFVQENEITEVKIHRGLSNDWIVRLAGQDGWWMLPCHMVPAHANMSRVRPFKGNPASLEDVMPSAISGLKMSGYPIAQKLYEQAMVAAKRIAEGRD